MSRRPTRLRDGPSGAGAQAAILEAVGDQIDNDDPPEVRQAYERLRKLGHSVGDARKLIAACLSVEIWHTLHPQGGGYNRERYLGALKELPQLPESLR